MSTRELEEEKSMLSMKTVNFDSVYPASKLMSPCFSSREEQTLSVFTRTDPLNDIKSPNEIRIGESFESSIKYFFYFRSMGMEPIQPKRNEEKEQSECFGKSHELEIVSEKTKGSLSFFKKSDETPTKAFYQRVFTRVSKEIVKVAFEPVPINKKSLLEIRHTSSYLKETEFEGSYLVNLGGFVWILLSME